MYSEEDRRRIFEAVKEKIIKDDNIFFIESAIAYTPISKPTFYAWFPPDSDEMKELVALLEKNKLKTKDYIRIKLRMGNKSSELLALYRMICTEDERKAIATNYNKTDLTSKDEKINFIGMTAEDLSNLEKLRELGKE